MLSNLLLGFLVAAISHKLMMSKYLSTEMYTALILLILTFIVMIIRIVVFS